MIYFTAHTFKCVCHCRRAMFRVLGMYNFDQSLNLKTTSLFTFLSELASFKENLMCFYIKHLSSTRWKALTSFIPYYYTNSYIQLLENSQETLGMHRNWPVMGSPILNSKSTNFVMISFSTGKLRRKKLFWTNKKFVFFFN